MEKFSNLSGPAKAGVGAGAAGGLVAVGVIAGTGQWIFLLVLVALLVLLVGGFLLFNWLKRRKKSAGFVGGLGEGGKNPPRGLSDPGQRARLDDLRKKFEQGIHEYRSRGKDLYTLPWYAIVGEPGSGKTEAIRHSNVGFPPGMQDEFQGVGGTINMNWWFTNNAVLLDTAGRLMFEELKPGETSEWKEFLQLLKKYRPDCPINGLFLVIPSDTLIKDTAEDIAAKAGKIARQLNVIQGTLGVRFPVFVVVTKCDKINGFREYFDGLTEPQLQHQMLGWANPDPLDSPFRPELVDQHLETVAQRLRRRRLGLMRDPVPENAEARRTDEVDALYALPHSFKLLAPRLRRYLETVFTGGEWTSSPLFLRGIYFTSAMREGAALDEDLARAIGVSVDQLGEGKVWERDRAYFLRDLFIEKVFREKGLVTRVKDTSRMLRQRRLALFSAVSIGLLLFLAVAYFSMHNLKDSVESRKKYWGTVASVGWTNKTWLGSIIPVLPNDTYADYATNLVRVENTRESLGNFHRRLREQVEEPMPSSWLFPSVSSKFRDDSQLAQRIVFEGGVIKPLLEATRRKMTRDLSRDSRAQEKLPEALATLVRLEADLVGWSKGTARGSIAPEEATKFLATLLEFATTSALTPDTNLVATFVQSYAAGTKGNAAWPPAWASGVSGAGPHSLTNNPALRDGLDQLLGAATNGIRAQLGTWQQTDALRVALLRFKEAEDAMARDAQAPGEAGEAGFLKQLRVAVEARSSIDAELERTKALPFFQGGLLIASAYQQFKSNALAGAARMLTTIGAEVDKALTLQAAQTTPVFPDIRQRLDKLRAELSTRVAGLDALAEPARLREIDEALFPGYAERGDAYRDLLKATEAKSYGSTPLLRSKAEPLDTFLKDTVVPVRSKSTPYTGQRKKEFAAICRFGADLAERTQRMHFMEAYLKEAETKVAGPIAFPLVKDRARAMPLDKLKEVARSIGDIVSVDLVAPGFQAAPFKDSGEWLKFTNWVIRVHQVARAVIDPNQEPFDCSVVLAAIDNPNPKDAWRFQFYNITLGTPASKPRTNEREDTLLGKVGVHEMFSLRVYPDSNKPPVGEPFDSGEWGALALVHNLEGVKADARGDMWLVDWPVVGKIPGASGAIRLKLRFVAPLPARDTWPARHW